VCRSGDSFVNLYLFCFRLQLTCYVLPAACCCRLYLLQFAGDAVTPTYSSRLYLFRVLLGTCPLPFLQCGVFPALYSPSAHLFRVCVGNLPSPTLRWSMLNVSHCHKPSPPKVCWQGSPNPPSLAGLFIYSSQGTPPHPTTCLFQFFIIQLFCVCVCGTGQSVQGAMLVYPRSGCGDTVCNLFAHLLVCVSQAG
jgi:hypothetical protein